MAVFSALAVCADAHAERALCRLFQLRRASALTMSIVLFLGATATTIAADRESQESPSEACLIETCEWTRATAQADGTHTSTNFVIRSFRGGPHAADVARHCEQVCLRLRSEVFGLEPSARWQPRCTVVLHASRSSYAAAAGPGGSQTIGSSTVSLSGGRVTQRRIDLLAVDAVKGLAALPHELVHVLFVDAFPNTPPPKWAEEGLALSFDPADKRARHKRDLHLALESKSTLPLHRLLAGANYPAPTHRAVFYAQSLSLAEYLMQQKPADEFVRFVKLSAERGTTRALLDVYQCAPSELERDWRRWIAGKAAVSHATRVRTPITI
jgi:hypothetical protein